MFRSSMLVYFQLNPSIELASELRRRLKVGGVNCPVGQGVVRKTKFARKRSRRQAEIKDGTHFVYFDLSSSRHTNAHIARVSQVLPLVINACNELQLLDVSVCKKAILSVTASNGSEEYFTRSITIPDVVIDLCHSYRIGINIEVVPCTQE